MSDIKNIKNDYSAKLNDNLSLEEINQIKTELFGKNGLISSQFKNIGSIPESDRKKFASDLNQIKDELQNLITNKIDEIASNNNVDRSAVAISFLLTHPANIIPIMGTNNIDRILRISDALKVKMDRITWFDLYTAALGREVA